MKKLIKIWELGLWLICFPQISEACNVPVYQFALANWAADDYQLLLFRDEPVTGISQGAFHLLETAAQDSQVNISLNYRLATDWNATASGVNVTFPWLRAFYPHTTRLFWEGLATPEHVRQLVDSPVRQALVQRLVVGDAAVWLFLETGNPAADSMVARGLAESLKILSDTLKIPATSVDSAGNCVIHPDSAEISVHFSMLTLPANAPEENIFRQMLLGIEPDLKSDAAAQPVAIPVFGRGRALYALIGRGINAKMIRRACEAMIGWCSCEVKSDNPGMDLLIRSDWKFTTRPAPAAKLPPLTGLARFVPVPAETVLDSASRTTPVVTPVADSTTRLTPITGESEVPAPDAVLFPVLWIFLAGILVVAGVTILMLRRNQIKN